MPRWHRPCEPEPGNTGGGKTIVNTTKESTLKTEYRNQNSFRNPKVLAEMAIFTALATALSTIVVYVLPQGGSITFASMVPIIWLALRRGPKVGIVTGVIYGLIQFIMLPYAIDPIQVLLDYPLAFGVLGLAGFFPTKPVARCSSRYYRSLHYELYFWRCLLGATICSKRGPTRLLLSLQWQLFVARIGNKRSHTLLAPEKQCLEGVHVIGETCR